MPLATPIIQLMDRDPISVDIKQKVSDALRILTAGRIHHLPVVADGTLVGLLSTTDMLVLQASLLAGDDAESFAFIDRQRSLDDIMQKDIISVSHRATVGDAAKQLSAGGFHSLPVVDQNNHLVGIVTTTDLIGHMLEASPRLELPEALKNRLRVLEAVAKAAQAFLHSGMAVVEHQKLERALEAARELESRASH
ncbi:MAG: CBS domain-containing protein [Gammaproteobacteria bacterium]|nr:CBS domain-containing protein [Gammaproteobacteria bacterium]